MSFLSWSSAFLLTILIELTIYTLIFTVQWRAKSWLEKARDCVLIHLMSHPAVFFLFPIYFPVDGWSYLIAAESFAIVAEAWWLAYRKYDYALSISFVSNLTSWLLGGELINYIN